MECVCEILKKLVGLVGIRDNGEETFSSCSTERSLIGEGGGVDVGVGREGFDSGCLGGAGNNVGGGPTKKGEV